MEGTASEFTDINDGYLQVALLFQRKNKQNVMLKFQKNKNKKRYENRNDQKNKKKKN